MHKRFGKFLFVVSIPFFITGCSLPVSFKNDIKPILATNCLTCHDGSGEGSSTSGFSVQNYDSVMKGTMYGPVVVPGSSISSSLYRMVAHEVDPAIQMPPHHDEAWLKVEKMR